VTAPIPPAVTHDAEGSWGPDNHGVLNPGNTFLIAMTEALGTISGTGSFAGTVIGVSLRLQIVYIAEPTIFPKLAPDTAHLDAVLTNRDQIDGRLTRDGISNTISFIRLKVGDRP
jgi:hypothetical protein